MADEEAKEPEFTTRSVKETQTRSVNGGIIVLLIDRTVRDDDGATIAVKQSDHVAVTGDEAGKLVSDFLAS